MILLQEYVARVEGGIVIKKQSKLLQKRHERGTVETSHGDENLTSDTCRVRHGDISTVSNDAPGIFLERKWRSSSERLFRNFFLYLECFFTTGESPVTVILKSSNLNVHEDGIIQWGASV